jgi:phage terminase large subunit-like protein
MSYFTDFSKIDLDKYYFDQKAAEGAVRYIENECYHSKGALAGTRLILSEWQKERIVKPIFGWKHKEPTIVKDATGRIVAKINKRKYRKAYIEIPKKNGKSTLMSAFAQIFLDIDPEKGSEIVGLAWGRKQAGIIFDMVAKSIAKSPRMNERINHYKSRNVLLSKDAEKRYTVWSKEAGGEDGQFPQLVIIDELHEHKNDEIVSVAEKSMLGRVNPLSLTVTTAGKDLDGIGYMRSEYCKQVASGIVEDESQLVCIFCADKEDDIFDKKTWYKANPQLGISISEDDFKEYVKDAKKSAHNENSFRRYHLNQWNNNVDSWISDASWWQCHWEVDIDFTKYPCYGGLDLSSTSDITAFTLMWLIDGVIYTKNWFWLPKEKAANSADVNNVFYANWVKQGYITETDGNVVDDDYILFKISQLSKKYDIRYIAYDNYRSHHLVSQFIELGLKCIEFRQGWKSMTAPTLELEKMVLKKKLNHFGNPVLRWMISNSVVSSDPSGQAVKVMKEKNKPSKKVDGAITNIMAYGLWLDPPEPISGDSYLNNGEIFVV